MVYCAGCALTIGPRIREMLGALDAVIGDVPFVSVFTFGEQGNIRPGVVDHGNLMASVMLLGKS